MPLDPKSQEFVPTSDEDDSESSDLEEKQEKKKQAAKKKKEEKKSNEKRVCSNIYYNPLSIFFNTIIYFKYYFW